MDEDEERPTKESNPFSFKAFVKKKGNEDADVFSVGQKSSSSRGNSRRSSSAVAASSNLETANTPFPEVETEAPPLKGKKENNPFSFSSFVKRESKMNHVQSQQAKSQNQKGIFDSTSESDTEESRPSLLHIPVGHQNPLVTKQQEGPRRDSDSFGSDEEDIHSTDRQTFLTLNGMELQLGLENESEMAEVKKLRAENTELSQQIEKLKEQLAREKQRSAKLSKRVETLQKKEAEETAALENMVQMVEKNLQLTTKRAVAAESEVARLQNDLLSVTAQLTESGRQKIEETFKAQFALIEDQSQVAAEKMVGAATKAEASLREIFTNVEDLKLASNLMYSVARAARISQCRPGNLDESS